MIHQTAIISETAQIGSNPSIGPYCVIGPNVKIGDNVVMHSHVVIDGFTTIGNNNKFFPFSAIGLAPQDLKYHGEKSSLEIGDNNLIREYVTMHPGTETGRMRTSVGSNCLFMASSHIAHDCIVGDHVIMANNATLGGHVVVGNYAIIGGLAAVHQFARIGDYSIVGGLTGISRDLAPFASSFSERDKIAGLNIIGLKRHDFSNADIKKIQDAFDILFFNENDKTFSEKIAEVTSKYQHEDKLKSLINFINSESIRSFVQAK